MMDKRDKDVNTYHIKARVATCIILVLVLLLTVFSVGWVKEGLVAAQAAETYDSAKADIVNSKSHDINFSAIHSVGNDVVSWIYIPGTAIDYPLVKGEDNDYYITHDAYGNDSTAGAIFMNCTNNADLGDPKTVIFGHNMRDGSMFSGLHAYEKEEFGTQHSDCYIYLDDGSVNHYKLRYYLFTDPSEDAVYLVSPTEETAERASAALSAVADIRYGECAGGNLICLSTCTHHIYRTVVVFELVDHQKPVVGVSEGMAEQGILSDSIKDDGQSGDGKVGGVLSANPVVSDNVAVGDADGVSVSENIQGVRTLLFPDTGVSATELITDGADSR